MQDSNKHLKIQLCLVQLCLVRLPNGNSFPPQVRKDIWVPPLTNVGMALNSISQCCLAQSLAPSAFVESELDTIVGSTLHHNPYAGHGTGQGQGNQAAVPVRPATRSNGSWVLVSKERRNP